MSYRVKVPMCRHSWEYAPYIVQGNRMRQPRICSKCGKEELVRKDFEPSELSRYFPLTTEQQLGLASEKVIQLMPKDVQVI